MAPGDVTQILERLAVIETKLDSGANLGNRLRILELAVYGVWGAVIGGAFGLGPFA